MSGQISQEHSDLVTVPLERLAWGRSGDKGDKANIGIMARAEAYLPWIAQVLTSEYVATRFVLHNALGGGGVASLRNDPQAKSFAQILLDTPISIPENLLES